MADSRVTVIIPTFNRTRYLAETVRSVLEQTRPVEEILIVDDGSAPPFQEALQAVAATSDSIRLIRLTPHQGVSHARNHGIAAAAGNYLLFLDDDDLLHPAMVATGLSILEAEATAGGVFCLSAVRHVDPGPTCRHPLFLLFDHERLKALPFHGTPLEPLKAKGLQRDPCHTLLSANVAIHSCLLRKSAVGSARFPAALGFGEDKYFWLRLAGQGCRFSFYPRVYAVVRRHGMNHSGGPFREKGEKQLAYYETLLEDGLLPGRRSRFLVYLKLLHIRLALCRRQRWPQIAQIAASPRWLLLEGMGFCRRRLILKWRFLRFRLAKGRWP